MTLPKILITRPLEKGSIFQQQLKEKNINGVLCPLMSYVDFPVSMDHINHIDIDNIIITSPHSVSILKNTDITTDKKIYAVGDGTYDALLSSGFQNIHKGDGTGQGLIHDILADHQKSPIDKMIHFSGADIATDFKTVLKDHNIDVTQHVLYKAVLTDHIPDTLWDQISSGDIRHITFFSKRSAKHFVDLAKMAQKNTLFSKIQCFCLHPRITEALINHGFETIHIAKNPSVTGMMEKICETAPFSDFIKDLAV